VELERLRDALTRLEGGRDRAWARPAATASPHQGPPAAPRAPPAAKPASVPARAPRGQNKAKVLDALKDGPMTASEIAKATGIATGTVSTLLTKLVKSGELAKADRGYTLPQ
jgi:predicted Rossmann fold nucleotide-binding protein DprA/Smf involved in DNA uptake